MAFVQKTTQLLTTAASQTVLLDSAPVAGNTLIAVLNGPQAIISGGGPSVKQGTTALVSAVGVGMGNAGHYDLGNSILFLIPSLTSTNQTLTIDHGGVAFNYAPSITVYEYSGLYLPAVPNVWSQGLGFGGPHEVAESIVPDSTAKAYTSFLAIATAMSGTDQLPSMTGSSLPWAVDGITSLSPVGLSLQPYGYVTTGSAISTHPDISVDFGLSSGVATIAMLILPFANVTAAPSINGVQFTDSPNCYIDGSSNIHIRIPYVRGHWDSTAATAALAWTPATNGNATADYQLVGGDTFAAVWTGIAGVINTAESLTLSVTETGSEATGIAHLVNATGAFNNDALFNPVDTGRVTAGTVWHQ